MALREPGEECEGWTGENISKAWMISTPVSSTTTGSPEQIEMA